MITTRLYKDDPTLYAFEAEVTEIHEASREGGKSLWQIGLDRSAFRPGDKGQLIATAKSGATLAVPVLAVEEDARGALWIYTQKPLLAGTVVRGEVLRPDCNLD